MKSSIQCRATAYNPTDPKPLYVDEHCRFSQNIHVWEVFCMFRHSVMTVTTSTLLADAPRPMPHPLLNFISGIPFLVKTK